MCRRTHPGPDHDSGKGISSGRSPTPQPVCPQCSPLPTPATLLQHSRPDPGSGAETAGAAGNTELITSTGFRLSKGVPASSLSPLTSPALPAPTGLQERLMGQEGRWVVHLLLVHYRPRGDCSTSFHWLSWVVAYGKELCCGDMVFPIYSVWIGKLVSLFLN